MGTNTIDMTQINAAATELMNLARRQAVGLVEEKTRREVALDHGIDKLEIIIGLCENVGPTTEEASESERVLSAWIRRACGSVPIFGAGVPLQQLQHALGTEGILPDWNRATAAAKLALEILTATRVDTRSNDS
jgi:hypothetical protein